MVGKRPTPALLVASAALVVAAASATGAGHEASSAADPSGSPPKLFSKSLRRKTLPAFLPGQLLATNVPAGSYLAQAKLVVERVSDSGEDNVLCFLEAYTGSRRTGSDFVAVDYVGAGGQFDRHVLALQLAPTIGDGGGSVRLSCYHPSGDPAIRMAASDIKISALRVRKSARRG
jgi:hypothetical protein